MMKLIKPYISFEEVEKEFREIFASGWFTKGPKVNQFKELLCNYTGAKYAHLATSATTALSAVLKMIDIKPGDEVVVSDFSFPATANVVEDLYATPVFVDVQRDTFTMDPMDLEKKISKKTKAVIFVDALGNPANSHRVREICRRHNIVMIQDSACGLGSSEKQTKVGNIADVTCFSFHPRKLLSTGEGGAILTNREDWNDWLKVKLDHGSVPKDGIFDFVEYGYNYRLPELQCVMGIKQLEKLDAIVDSRIILREKLKNGLEKLGFEAQKVPDEVRFNVQSLVFRVPEKINRDALIRHLKECQIETTIGTYCMSNCTYYRKKYNQVQAVALELQKTTITFPCHDDVNIDLIVDAVKNFKG